MGTTTDTNTEFLFEAKVFAVEGAYFARAADGSAHFFVPLGGVVASVPVGAVRREFDIELDGPDEMVLGMIDKALAYVTQIRPGDSIPSELLDGTASWTFEPEHEAIAKGRLLSALTRWHVAEPETPPARAAMAEFEDGETWAVHGEAALAALAATLQLDAPDQALSRVERVWREFAYIEALRLHYETLFMLPKTMTVWRDQLARDRSRREEYDNMLSLVRTPLRIGRRRFCEADALVDDAPSAVRDPDATVGTIRSLRDALHRDAQAWRDVAPQWSSVSPSSEDAARRATYRMLATHFAEERQWA